MVRRWRLIGHFLILYYLPHRQARSLAVARAMQAELEAEARAHARHPAGAMMPGSGRDDWRKRARDEAEFYGEHPSDSEYSQYSFDAMADDYARSGSDYDDAEHDFHRRRNGAGEAYRYAGGTGVTGVHGSLA
jgi:hypothetical protein